MARKKRESSNNIRKIFNKNVGKQWADCKTGKKCGRSGVKTSERSNTQSNPSINQFKPNISTSAARRRSRAGRTSSS